MIAPKFLSKTELLEIPVPPQTETYVPVPCELIIDYVEGLVKEKQFLTYESEFMVSRSGQQQRLRFFFSTESDPDFVQELCVVNSYDKSIAFRSASGASVYICTNGSMLGDVKMYSKHTGDILDDLTEFLKGTSDNMRKDLEKLQGMYDFGKDVLIDDFDKARILGTCFLNDALTSSQLNFIKEQMKESQYDYGVAEDTFWHFYQICTLSLNTTNPTDYFERRKFVEAIFYKLYETYSLSADLF